MTVFSTECHFAFSYSVINSDKDNECFCLTFVFIKPISKWDQCSLYKFHPHQKQNASGDLASFHAHKRIWNGVLAVQVYNFFGPYGLTTKKSHIAFFLKFFRDSLKLERPWAFTFLGSLNPRDHTINSTFMYFLGSLSKTKKQLLKRSSLSFKLHKNERLEKEKGFYAHVSLLQQSIESSSSLVPILHPCQMGGLSIAFESWSFHWVYSPPTSYSSGHPWRLVYVSSSQCCQVILSDVPISLKIVCLKFTSCPVLCTDLHVSVLFWSLHHLPLFCVDWWRIHQCLPSTNFILSTCVHHSGMNSRNSSLLWYLGGHFHHWWFSLRLLAVYIIDH